MEVADCQRLNENITELSAGSGLTSDVLRARALEYYNSCQPQTSRQSGGSVLKSGSMTHINGLVNGNNTTNKLLKIHDKHKDKVLQHTVGNQRLITPHGRVDRPQRTHSERANRVFSEHAVNHSVVSNCTTISPNKLGLYRSNSSLDLDHSEELEEDGNHLLRRNYGSASSLDVISTAGENFFAMLREYRNENVDHKNRNVFKIHEYHKHKTDSLPITSQHNSNPNGNFKSNNPVNLEESQSPKLKTKLQRLWESKDRSKVKTKMISGEPSLFKKLRGSKPDNIETYNKGSDNNLDSETRLEEKLRKKSFCSL